MTTQSAPVEPTRTPPVPWIQRVYDAAPVAPGWVGAGLVALLLVAYLAMELALGRFRGGSGLDLVGMGLLTLLLAVLLAYAITANVAVTREAVRNGRRIRETLALPGPARDALASRLASPSRGLLLAGSLFGLALSLAAPLLEIQEEPWHPYDPRGWVPESAWHRALTPVLGWWMGRLLGLVVALSRAFSEAAQRLEHVDLLDAASLAPFVRQGLAQALAVVGFVALFALYLVDVERYGLMFLVVGAVTVAAASAGLLLPLRGVHRRLREAKHAELVRVDAAIRGDAGALRHSPIAARAPALGLADLVAWRQLVAAAREWPFDASSLGRFAFYLAIPLGSWSGAALVERLIDAVLD
ncbi:MAG: hypothetical protein R3263_10790 [Myxococcota bacterium]|nr:hypothetical protein [Myxococcota bacterium]